MSTKISYHELHHARDSYITFSELFIGVKGYRYERRKKYRLTSQDTKYLYCMSDKIRKSDLDNVEYTIEPKKDKPTRKKLKKQKKREKHIESSKTKAFGQK